MYIHHLFMHLFMHLFLVLVALCLIKCFGTQDFLTKFRLCLFFAWILSYAKNATFFGLLVHFLLSIGFLIYYLFRFTALVFTNTLSSVSVFFGAFTKYKSQALLLILPAAACIMREPPYKNDCVIFNSVNRPVNSTYKANVFNKFLISLTNFSVNVYVAIDISINSNTIICGKVPSGKDLYHWDQPVDLQCWSVGLFMYAAGFWKRWFSNNLSCNWLLQHFMTHSKVKGYSNS